MFLLIAYKVYLSYNLNGDKDLMKIYLHRKRGW
jgi:hypothetical protein